MKEMKAWAAVALSVLIYGCSLNLSAPSAEKERFLLPAGSAPAPAAHRHPGVLRIGRFDVAQPFEGEELVYRTGELRYESDFYDEWFIAPGPMIRDRVAQYLAQAKPFASVVAAPQLEASYELRGRVLELYADARDKARPAAVIAVHFYVVQASGENDRIVFDRTYRQRVPLADARGPAVVAGLGRGLHTILGTLAHDLETAPPR